MPKPRMLRVWPNPFSAIDHEGRPAGVVSLEPVGDGITVFDDRRFVGCVLKSKVTKKVPRGSAQQNEQDTWFEYDKEPTTVPLTPYYVRAVRTGELVCADEASAQKAGVKFADPAKFLAAARDGAVKHIEEVVSHESHDDDFCDPVKSFSFGPMGDSTPVSTKPEDKAPKTTKAEPKGGV